MKRITFPWKCRPTYIFKGEVDKEEVVVPVRRKEKFDNVRRLVR